jgi:hypothetical protein
MSPTVEMSACKLGNIEVKSIKVITPNRVFMLLFRILVLMRKVLPWGVGLVSIVGLGGALTGGSGYELMLSPGADRHTVAATQQASIVPLTG